jgi:hypothetical protein
LEERKSRKEEVGEGRQSRQNVKGGRRKSRKKGRTPRKEVKERNQGSQGRKEGRKEAFFFCFPPDFKINCFARSEKLEVTREGEGGVIGSASTTNTTVIDVTDANHHRQTPSPSSPFLTNIPSVFGGVGFYIMRKREARLPSLPLSSPDIYRLATT